MIEGVIVGANVTQEWLIPWWWKHYSKYNSFPVTFIDFGMSQKSVSWCIERGQLIPLNHSTNFVAEKKESIRSLQKSGKSGMGKMSGNGVEHVSKNPSRSYLRLTRKQFGLTSTVKYSLSIAFEELSREWNWLRNRALIPFFVNFLWKMTKKLAIFCENITFSEHIIE